MGMPQTPCEKVRGCLICLAFGAIVAIPGVPLLRWVEGMQSGDFWLAVATGAASALLLLWGWTRLDRPIRRRWGWTSLLLFVMGDVLVVYVLLAIGIRTAETLGL